MPRRGEARRGGVLHQPVGLEDAAEVAETGSFCFVVGLEDSFEGGAGAAGFPVEKLGAAFGVAVGPEIALLGFARSGFEVSDGGFVGLEGVGAEEAAAGQVVKGAQPVTGEGFPVDHVLPGDFDCKALFEALFLAVEGEVLAVFVGDDFGDEAGGGEAAFLEAFREAGDEGGAVDVVAGDVFSADEAFAGEPAGVVVELFGDFLADLTPGAGVGFDFFGVEDGVLAGEVFGEAGFAVFAGFFRGDDFEVASRRGVLGGVGLFWTQAGEQEFELGGVELFAFGSEELADEEVDSFAQEGVFLGQGGVAFDKFFNLV